MYLQVEPHQEYAISSGPSGPWCSPGSYNFDVYDVLIQSDSGMWSMDMCIKISREAC